MATLSDNTEKTKNAPVNSATSASTVRLTRYARDRLLMRAADSPGAAAVTPGGQPGVRCSEVMNAWRSAPTLSLTSMRESWPTRPNRSCAAAMSMTARGAPLALTVPATLTASSARPDCMRNCGPFGAEPPSASLADPDSNDRAAAFRKTASGAKMANRSGFVSPVRSDVPLGTGMRPGATYPTTSASTPTTRSGLRAPVAVTTLVLISSIGEA